MKKIILVTGGAGFIGGNFVRRALASGKRIVTLDSLGYAGNLATLQSVLDDPGHTFIQGSILDRSLLSDILLEYRPQSIVHFAAESHVDRSIDDPECFIETNIKGTYVLLEASRTYLDEVRGRDRPKDFRFIHVSTDEVFGSIAEGSVTEEAPYSPNSPYAASKASSDHLVRAWSKTYNFPGIITNCSNNYGPYQLPEKLIPLMILSARAGESLPVYGDGSNVREWLHVHDHCDALMKILRSGVPGEAYNIGGGEERSNLNVVTTICRLLDKLLPRSDRSAHEGLISFVADRPGHDWRYAIDATKLHRDLGWSPAVQFEDGLEKTVSWYLASTSWLQSVSGNKHVGRRIGTKVGG